MAAPIIDSVDVSPATIAPGEQATITIDARDPDSVTVDLGAEVFDADGDKTGQSASLRIEDPLSYALSEASGPGGTIEQDPDQPNVWYYTAPAG